MSNRPSARQRSAVSATRAQQARQQQKKSRNTMFIIVAVAVVLVGGVLAAVTVGKSSKKSALPVPTGAEAAAIVTKVTTIPPSVLDEIGKGAIVASPKPLAGDPLTDNGKPAVLYVGAEYCPFCAGERWAMVNALARFGTFSNLSFTHSSSSDVYPNTQTFSFHGSSYSSDYISFTGVETATNQSTGNGGYKQLETMTDAQLSVFQTANPGGGFPFLDIGGTYVVAGASYDVSVLQNKTAAQIADAMADPTSAVAKGVIGTANTLTAAICTLTGQKPAAVCGAAGVKAITLAT